LYAYLFGLHTARNDAIFHLDANMLVGGGAVDAWLRRAGLLFDQRNDIIGISPLPGPPTPNVTVANTHGWLRRDDSEPGAHRYNRFCFRALYIHRSAFTRRLGPISLRLAAPLHVLSGWTAGHPPYRDLDVTISRMMQDRGLAMLGALGPPPGLWTLRPHVRSPTLADRLPDIVRAVESACVPDAQRGDRELQDALPEWLHPPPAPVVRIPTPIALHSVA
jgi:hypothetical protein